MTTRVIVVGSGLAGLMCALHADAAGCAVTILTQGDLGEGNSRHAQGGIAAAVRPDDSPAAHGRDTLVAGSAAGTAADATAAGADADAVETLTSAGPAMIDELVRLGVDFDRDASGELSVGLEAAHTHPRILRVGGDATGAGIQSAVVAAVRARPIEVRVETFVTDLVVGAGRVRGVAALVGGRREKIDADAVVLATGGAGQLYAHTTNPSGATGDGLAMALRAGAAVADLEFVQFHPTVLAGGELVSEAVRGEGATLIDDAGRRFVFDAHPDGELAPRDVVARALASTMTAQAGRPARLDARGLRADAASTAAFLAARFPSIDRAVRALGWDWSRVAVPVTPAAHYLMGGIVTDAWGRSSIPGLFAVGEVARTGVHGANRLASNSLLEAAVFGARAGDAVGADSRGTWPAIGPDLDRRRSEARPDPAFRPPVAGPAFSRDELQRLMWLHVGLERDAPGLRTALRLLERWAASAAPPGSIAEHEDANLLRVARAVTAAALARPRSRGAHFRRDDRPVVTADSPLVSSGAR